MANEPEARTVVLPQKIWRETDSRAGAGGMSISAIIEQALLSYFDLTGGTQVAGAEEESVPQSVEDRAGAIERLRTDEDTGTQDKLLPGSRSFGSGK
jgi:hypothetical protein